MRVVSLCYHDVVEEAEASGFGGAEAASYKLKPDDFKRHLEALAHSQALVASFPELRDGGPERPRCLLTFDDGGASACTRIAPLLETFGWRGHFFIVTDYIGAPGFLGRAEIRELRRRGHIIGSHSRSHRGRMSALPGSRLLDEWGASREILSDLLGEEVSLAAVPSGCYCRRVAEAAAASGLKALFTLEPKAHSENVAGCQVLGRYLIKRSATPETAARLASGSLLPRLAQWFLWNSKQAAKSGLGTLYPKVRKAYFSWQGPAR